MKRFATYIFLAAAITVSCSNEPELVHLTFTESFEDFPNPERGFYKHMLLDRLTSVDQLEGLREQSITLIYGKIPANDFRESDLSDEFLGKIQTGFDLAREAGVKTIFCVSYGDRVGAEDASKEWVFRHLDQLKPLLERNEDVIYIAKAGFIGPWGEWHSSTHGLDTTENRRDILVKILDVLPVNRMVALRSPSHKLDIFNGEVLGQEKAFDGSYIARTGHHNDCFLSGNSDVGTYLAPKTRDEWLAYIGGETRFTPYGGETCALNDLSQCENALKEMEILHASWLNIGYHPEVLKRWDETGCMDEIARRLGYCFVLRDAILPQEAAPGETMSIEMTLDNVGFAAPVNPRPVEIVLKNNTDGTSHSIPVDADPRFWQPGNPIMLSADILVPANVPEGTYTVLLRLPDAAESLRDDPRYAIRLANENTWIETEGANAIYDALEVGD